MSGKARILSAEFVTSVAEYSSLPHDLTPEIAFAGRSNCGKSTLLNAICGRKALARVSKTPGRTQALNYFSAVFEDDDRQKFEANLVDLPGYGYAAVNKKLKQHWADLLQRYLTEREQVKVVVLLHDCRRDISDDERWFVDADLGKDLFVVLTKADKLKRRQLESCQRLVKNDLEIPDDRLFVTSVLGGKKQGVEELLSGLVRSLR